MAKGMAQEKAFGRFPLKTCRDTMRRYRNKRFKACTERRSFRGECRIRIGFGYEIQVHGSLPVRLPGWTNNVVYSGGLRSFAAEGRITEFTEAAGGEAGSQKQDRQLCNPPFTAILPPRTILASAFLSTLR